MLNAIFARSRTAIAALLLAAAPATAGQIKHVFVIAMENTDAREIYGHPERAPYINNTLMPVAARAQSFLDKLDNAILSEPHYVIMEAATETFSDVTFVDDREPSPQNSTRSRAHLVTQLTAAGKNWRAYQEDMGPANGACPVKSAGLYAAKHNPFVFFHDIAGNPPDPDNRNCARHMRPYSAFANDLARNDMPEYTFITPNLCNDMHGDDACPPGDRIATGDAWLAKEMPRLMKWADAHASAIFIIWDEGVMTQEIPFFALGPGVARGRVSTVLFDHRSLVRSVEEIFRLPKLPAVGAANGFADLFRRGQYP